MPLHAEAGACGPRESLLWRLGRLLRALAEIRYPSPGEPAVPPAAMIKPTQREKNAVRAHRCDWP